MAFWCIAGTLNPYGNMASSVRWWICDGSILSAIWLIWMVTIDSSNDFL